MYMLHPILHDLANVKAWRETLIRRTLALRLDSLGHLYGTMGM